MNASIPQSRSLNRRGIWVFWPTFCILVTVMFSAFPRSSIAEAGLIVLNESQIIPNLSLSGRFYTNENQNVVFELESIYRIGIRKYICPDAEWDWKKVEKASQVFAYDVNVLKPMNVFHFLESSGFGECKGLRR